MTDAIDVERCLPTSGLMPEDEEMASFYNARVFPPAGSSYGYTAVFPEGWRKQPDLPGETTVPSPVRFAALGVFTPTPRLLPPVMVSFGTTPAPEGATVSSCFEAYCEVHGYKILAKRSDTFLAGRVIDGLVSIEAPRVGPILARFAMFEATGRLFGLSGMAPAALYPRFVRPLSLALTTFELVWPTRPTMRLV